MPRKPGKCTKSTQVSIRLQLSETFFGEQEATSTTTEHVESVFVSRIWKKMTSQIQRHCHWQVTCYAAESATCFQYGPEIRRAPNLLADNNWKRPLELVNNCSNDFSSL